MGTAAESAPICTFSSNLATLQAVIMNDRVIYDTMFCSYDLLCVFTVQYTEIDLKTREEYLALVPGKIH